uniref:Uncharacterized protein n=1 Tax=Cannabis sativa TaxID=3483 RepID=A0A803NH78_CANSA
MGGIAVMDKVRRGSPIWYHHLSSHEDFFPSISEDGEGNELKSPLTRIRMIGVVGLLTSGLVLCTLSTLHSTSSSFMNQSAWSKNSLMDPIVNRSMSDQSLPFGSMPASIVARRPSSIKDLTLVASVLARQGKLAVEIKSVFHELDILVGNLKYHYWVESISVAGKFYISHLPLPPTSRDFQSVDLGENGEALLRLSFRPDSWWREFPRGRDGGCLCDFGPAPKLLRDFDIVFSNGRLAVLTSISPPYGLLVSPNSCLSGVNPWISMVNPTKFLTPAPKLSH